MPAKKVKNECTDAFPDGDRENDCRESFRQVDPPEKDRKDRGYLCQSQDPASKKNAGKNTIYYQKRNAERQRKVKQAEHIAKDKTKQSHIFIKKDRICGTCDAGISGHDGKADHQSDRTAGDDDT